MRAGQVRSGDKVDGRIVDTMRATGEGLFFYFTDGTRDAVGRSPLSEVKS